MFCRKAMLPFGSHQAPREVEVEVEVGVYGVWCRVYGVGCRVQVVWCRMQIVWCIVQVVRCRVKGVECGVQDAGRRVSGVTGKVDIRLPGKGNSNSHGTRPFYCNPLDDSVDSDQ